MLDFFEVFSSAILNAWTARVIVSASSAAWSIVRTYFWGCTVSFRRDVVRGRKSSLIATESRAFIGPSDQPTIGQRFVKDSIGVSFFLVCRSKYKFIMHIGKAN
jgi:hypothetical protein